MSMSNNFDTSRGILTPLQALSGGDLRTKRRSVEKFLGENAARWSGYMLPVPIGG